MYYDITSPNAAYNWICNTLQIKQGTLAKDYSVKCENDINMFCKIHAQEIEKIDIDSLEIVAFQVTTNYDNCESLKKYGIRNLQWILSNKTEVNRLLRKNNISFDVQQKTMCIDGKIYNIDYDELKNKIIFNDDEKTLELIAHKIYYDFQINSFLFCKDIFGYSTVSRTPEFLSTLSQFNNNANRVKDEWKKQSKPYVIKYKAKVSDFAYFTFYDNEKKYCDDKNEKYQWLKNELVSLAIKGMLKKLPNEKYGYMRPDTVVMPDDILDIIPAGEWDESILKYFK